MNPVSKCGHPGLKSQGLGETILVQRESLGKETPAFVKRAAAAKVLGFLCFLAAGAVIFCAGAYTGQQYPLLKAIPECEAATADSIVEKNIYTPVEKVVETVVYEPVETIVYEEVEKPVVQKVEVLQKIAPFESLASLEQWLGNTAVINIGFSIAGQNGPDTRFDCDDYATGLQAKALQDGYLISVEVIRPAEYNALFQQKQLPEGEIHAINSAIIGNEVYFIEPQTKEVAFAVYID